MLKDLMRFYLITEFSYENILFIHIYSLAWDFYKKNCPHKKNDVIPAGFSISLIYLILK